MTDIVLPRKGSITIVPHGDGMVRPEVAAIPAAATAILIALAISWSPGQCGPGLTGLTIVLLAAAGFSAAAMLALLRFFLSAAAIAGMATVFAVAGLVLVASSGCH